MNSQQQKEKEFQKKNQEIMSLLYENPGDLYSWEELLRLQDSQNSILNLDLKSTYEVKMSVIEKGLKANKNEEFFLLYKTL